MKSSLLALRTAIAVCGTLCLLPGESMAAGSTCFSTLPLASMTITSYFGMRLHPLKKIRRLHDGVDFRASTGTKMFAVQPGRVRFTGWMTGGGNTVEILGADGVVARYMHSSKLIAKMGDNVSAGDVVAEAGNTGQSGMTAHLHLTTLTNGSQRVDPLQFFCGQSFAVKPGTSTPLAYEAGDPAQPVAVVNAGTPAQAPADSPPGTPSPASVPGGVTGLVAPPMQTFPTMDDMSMRDFLSTETSKRFLNPQWYQELVDPAAALRADPKNAGQTYDSSRMDPKVYMLRELNIIMSLDNLMASERYTTRENIEARVAAFLSLDAKNYSDKVLSILRSQNSR